MSSPGFGDEAEWDLVVLTYPNQTGTDLLITVPGKYDWRLLGLRINLLSSAAVANREMRVLLDGGSAQATYSLVGSPYLQAASLDWTYNFNRGLGDHFQDARLDSIMLPLPDVQLSAGHRVSTAISLLQAGDQLRFICLAVLQRLRVPAVQLGRETLLADTRIAEAALG